ncbi:alpha/beta hydrolase [Salinibaculum rarum]|uniref:alpha/beta hydrolase n=1 Tax=Salinibaculum rarum TaxID=3058903 RepID=UPI00265FDF54|nr:dienelactone hydrolase family protein [Salinibaculum sp. KK48]
MSETLRLPGPRDVRATVSRTDTEAAVVACPPHPQMGGDRRDGRLRAVSDALDDRAIACLRFDYGPWDEGQAEVTDARSALAWARENFQTVGLFGYSFGGAVALRAATQESQSDSAPAALSLLAPANSLAGDSVVDAVDAVPCPVQVLYGERDDTVDSVPVAQRARERGHTVEALSADHFFVGQQARVAESVATFFADSM